MRRFEFRTSDHEKQRITMAARRIRMTLNAFVRFSLRRIITDRHVIQPFRSRAPKRKG